MNITLKKRVVATTILLIIILTAGFLDHATSTRAKTSHIIDQTGVISKQDLPRFEQYLSYIMDESGIDIRIVFLPTTDERSIESLAREMMDEYAVGAHTGNERGLLLLYDLEGQRLKVEVGYGLEGWFPDIFIHHLTENHARAFFSSDKLSVGLRLMIRLLQHRIREAVLNDEFDPQIFNKMKSSSHLSGGGGVSVTMPIGDNQSAFKNAKLVRHNSYPAGSTPAETYESYLAWLKSWPTSANVDFFTSASRRYVSRLPVSSAYAEFILYGELGKSYEIIKRGNLAILYFTNTPFVSPHFFIYSDGHWQMDLVAEVRNTREHVGGIYTWSYSGKQDEYSRTFSDLLMEKQGYWRFNDGDNRQLTVP